MSKTVRAPLRQSLAEKLAPFTKKVEVEFAQGELTIFTPPKVVGTNLSTFRAMFWRKGSQSKDQALLMGTQQCLHSNNVLQPDGSYKKERCAEFADRGFLCGKHDFWVIQMVHKTKPPFRDFDAEDVDCVIRTEQRALDGIVMQELGLARAARNLRVIAGVNMTYDPGLYAQPDAPEVFDLEDGDFIED